jgi:K+-transporting ATPase KdpF subunit
MSFLQWLSAGVALVLVGYLLYALIKAEEF